MDKEFIERQKRIVSETKNGALFVGLLELGQYLNFSELSKGIFNESEEWFKQRRHRMKVKRRYVDFSEDEYQKMTDAFRDIAAKFNVMADAIDVAKLK